jgi:hypothetical protein
MVYFLKVTALTMNIHKKEDLIMEQNIDLPSELSRLFGDTTMPPEAWKVINDFWNDLTNFERKQLIDKLVKQPDPLMRVLTVMMDTKSNKLKFADVNNFIAEHLKTALNVTEFTITYAKLEGNVWKVNISYPERNEIGNLVSNANALFILDNQTGEVIQFQKGSYWTT